MSISSKIRNTVKLITDPGFRFCYLASQGRYRDMSDEEFLKKMFKIRMGYELDLEHPVTFCEKLQWLKLYDRNPIYTQMVDKYAVKQLVTDRIGPGHVVPLLGVWDDPDSIDISGLPDRFILKCTHNSGAFVICTDKSTFDLEQAKSTLKKKFDIDYFWGTREWAYKDVPKRIIAEEYIDTLGKQSSIEYKLTCFDGVARNITVCRGIAHSDYELRKNDNYDRDLNHLDWYAFYKNSPEPFTFPEQIHEIIEYAEKLSAGIPQVRVDFYLHDGIVYFGEFTFYTWAGFIEFTPPDQDRIMGDMIQLPPRRV